MSRNQNHTKTYSNRKNYVIDSNNLSAKFFINQIDNYDKTFPDFRKPREIGSFISTKRIESMKKKGKCDDENAANYGVKFLC